MGKTDCGPLYIGKYSLIYTQLAQPKADLISIPYICLTPKTTTQNPMSVLTASKKIIEELILDIEEEKCVLLIGPEIAGSGGQSQTRDIHEQLLEQEAQHIAYYYPNDSLFLFKEDAHKDRAIRRLKGLYRQLEPPKALYQKILELPIPLIISLNPDTMLSRTADELGLVHEFKHFRYSGGATDEVAAPSNQRPLIYNLSGSLAEEESLVLDYEDLFQLLRAVLPDGLPNKIRLQLRRANSFLFLGFDFEKWYSQLLLQLLTYERKGRPKFAVRARPKDHHAKDFLINQFQLQFLADDEYFFDTLHEALGKEGLLRSLHFPEASGPVPLAEIRQLVAVGKLSEALSLLDSYSLPPEQRQELASLQARYQNWQKKDNKGLYHIGESEPIFNRITDDFLNLLNRLS